MMKDHKAFFFCDNCSLWKWERKGSSRLSCFLKVCNRYYFDRVQVKNTYYNGIYLGNFSNA